MFLTLKGLVDVNYLSPEVPVSFIVFLPVSYSLGSRRRNELGCSRRSDSGERCEVKRSAKKLKANSPPLLFIAFFTSHRSPLSERLEQAKTSRGLGRREKKEGSYMRKRFSK